MSTAHGSGRLLGKESQALAGETMSVYEMGEAEGRKMDRS